MIWYSFGPFALDPGTRVLRRDGHPVVITAKIFELLVLLVQNRGRLVTKDELRSKLWPDTIVEEANLAQSVSVLRKILGDTPQDHRYIATIPGQGYSFICSVVENPLSSNSPEQSNPSFFRGLRRSLSHNSARAAIAISLLSAGAYVAFQHPSPAVFYSAVPLTSYAGSEMCPSFAPDGERVAFSWDGERQDNFDIYVKQIGAGTPLRLTSGPEPDLSPAWSPDGRTIAYLHVLPDQNAEVLLMPAAGPGPARKLTTVTAPRQSCFRLRFTAWSPDGKWIAVSDGPHNNGVMSLVLVSAESGERRRVTSPPFDYDDFSPAFSPDMSRLAFIRYTSIGASAGDLYLVKLSSDLTPIGEPERLTSFNRQVSSPVWTPDGRSVLFARHEIGGSPSLWRVHIGGDRRIEPLLIPADNSLTMTLSPKGNKIVYTRESENVNIWSIDLKHSDRAERVGPQITSTWTEDNPQFSPDGQRIAYQSSRSGRMEIWVCDRDGSHPRQLTHLEAVISGFARWSPDGKKIAFHSRPKSSASLYLIDPEGGKPEQLTSEMENNFSPSWSHDGRWIYFASRRSGESDIWKIPATGGIATRMGEQSGWCPLESKDGRFLYYTTMSRGTLRAIPLSGGPERELFSGLDQSGSAYAPATDGIYFMRPMANTRKCELALFHFASNRIITLAEISHPVSLGLALSPNEDVLLYSQIDRQTSDLMLVDNFR